MKYNSLSSQLDRYTETPYYRQKLSPKSPKLKENIAESKNFFNVNLILNNLYRR